MTMEEITVLIIGLTVGFSIGALCTLIYLKIKYDPLMGYFDAHTRYEYWKKELGK